ncbi:NAD+ diphosphatase [Crossiella equi]|uniref:NAD(+) diphosphatase n=1 Tax=Crossiella equi TaxID=130796 RepID=A0ABS5A3V4_9PSEU|nr:NAD(+) diphosphatase [Crossiella equi]MBP2471263.1 NAD+ diphosphatase [Crossiella equi]
MPDLKIAYNALPLDRAGKYRADPAWLTEVRGRAGSAVTPLWQGGVLVREGRPLELPASTELGVDPVFLALDGERGRFTADLSALTEDQACVRAGAEGVLDVRALFPLLPAGESTLLAFARGILHWHRTQRFCGSCGSTTEVRHGGHLRVCTAQACGQWLFPRIEPAVIMLVESPDEPRRCLLGRHRGAAEGAFSTLAGFVEIGESLEDAVRREVAEESGVVVDEVRYVASQAWPFPSGLMVGFHARAAAEAIAVDADELVEARWFTPAEIRARVAADPLAFKPDSIGRHLVEAWLAEN